MEGIASGCTQRSGGRGRQPEARAGRLATLESYLRAAEHRARPGRVSGRIGQALPSVDSEHQVVAWFHTHPNTAEEGYKPGYTREDIVFTRLVARVPGFLVSHEGISTISC